MSDIIRLLTYGATQITDEMHMKLAMEAMKRALMPSVTLPPHPWFKLTLPRAKAPK